MVTATIEPALVLMRAKRKREAEQYLRGLVVVQEFYEEAWLLLGIVVEDDEERLTAWRNVLHLNPHHPQVRPWLSEHHVRLASHAKEPSAAYTHLQQAVELDETNQEAWRQLDMVAEALDERIIALENLLLLGGGDGYTAAQLAYLRRIGRDPFLTADYYIERGDIARAEQVYHHFITGQTRRNRRMAQRAQRAWQTLRRRAQGQLRVAMPRPLATLTRLSIGPFLLYALLLFLHIGLNPWHMTPTHLAGGFMVLFGTFLMLGARTSPANPWWGRLWGIYTFIWPVRAGAWGMGLLCAVAPYGWLFAEAWERYQQVPFPPLGW